MANRCKECGGKVPENRSETCSKVCYDKWSPKFFAALKELSDKLPRVKLHF